MFVVFLTILCFQILSGSFVTEEKNHKTNFLFNGVRDRVSTGKYKYQIILQYE